MVKALTFRLLQAFLTLRELAPQILTDLALKPSFYVPSSSEVAKIFCLFTARLLPTFLSPPKPTYTRQCIERGQACKILGLLQ